MGDGRIAMFFKQIDTARDSLAKLNKQQAAGVDQGVVAKTVKPSVQEPPQHTISPADLMIAGGRNERELVSNLNSFLQRKEAMWTLMKLLPAKPHDIPWYQPLSPYNGLPLEIQKKVNLLDKNRAFRKSSAIDVLNRTSNAMKLYKQLYKENAPNR